MNKATYKIIAIDLDGTLVRSDQTLSDYTVEKLINAQEKGIKVVIATGRPTYGAAPIAEALHLADYAGYLLSYNGGEITQWKDKHAVYSATLPPTLLPFLYDYSKQNGLPLLTYIKDNVVTEDGTNKYIQYSAMRNHMTIKEVDSFLDVATLSLGKCIMVGDPTQLADHEQRLSALLAGQASAYRSEPFFLEIVPKGIDKAAGLMKILEAEHLSPSDLMAFGDGYNDLPMLRLAGKGVAMGNASQTIKQEADWIAESNNDDGVAKAIEALILE